MADRDFYEVACLPVAFLFTAQAALLEAAAASSGEGGEEGEEEGEGEVSPELLGVVPKSLEGFDAGMNDDLNTPRYGFAWDSSTPGESLNRVGPDTRPSDPLFLKGLCRRPVGWTRPHFQHRVRAISEPVHTAYHTL